ncbi:MAG: DUF6174 domain-containing protein [Pseudomonadota bacterium]
MKSTTKSNKPLRALLPIAATALVLLILLAATVPLMHWANESGRAARLADGLGVWRELGITNYDLTIEQRCACLPAGQRAIDVRVRNGQLADVRDADRQPIDPLRLPMTVPQIFAAVEEAIRREPDSIGVEYDKNYGFPREFSFDPSHSVDDDELGVTVQTFRPLAR